MATYKVASEDLAEASTQLTTGSSELEGTLSQLRKIVDGLAADWQGTGSSAFAELYQEFHSAGAQLTESLEGISTLLNKAAVSYAESEQSVTSAFRG